MAEKPLKRRPARLIHHRITRRLIKMKIENLTIGFRPAEIKPGQPHRGNVIADFDLITNDIHADPPGPMQVQLKSPDIQWPMIGTNEERNKIHDQDIKDATTKIKEGLKCLGIPDM